MKSRQYKFSRITKFILIFISATLLISSTADACVRLLYTGDDNTVITGRALDWLGDTSTNLWIFPRGIKRDGAAGANSLTWTSQYGSVVAAFFGGSFDGMNEEGLVANCLYLSPETDYGKPGNNPTISVSLWAQYVLDNYASVEEAVNNLIEEPFKIQPVSFTYSTIEFKGLMHLAISDASGDSAIFEYINGELVVHHGKEYVVLTNSPDYDTHLAKLKDWKEQFGPDAINTNLPGSISSEDRFIRGSFLLESIPKSEAEEYITSVPGHSFINQAIAGVRSILRGDSRPFGYSKSCLWMSISDQKNRIYYFDSASSLSIFWVDFKDVDFSAGAPVKKLTVEGGAVYSGNTASLFEETKPFEFRQADLAP